MVYSFKLFLLASLAIASGAILSGCNEDPYDPMIGPRNPIPGAKKYLASRNDLNETEKQAVLNLQPCSPRVLAMLSDAPSREVRSLLAENPSIDSETMDKFLKDHEVGVRAYLSLNPKTPRQVLVQLRSDPDPNVNWGVARNPNWTAEDLRKMYAEKSASPVLIAGNPSSPKEILEELSRSKDHSVQTALANNPSIGVGIVKWLLQEGNSATKKMLVDNPATPREVVEALAKDSDPDVGKFAREFLKRAH
jgi:hypothetical protein